MTSAPKELIFEEEAREILKEGIDMLANAVGVTLGPKGKNVGITQGGGSPAITNDGNTIVKDIELKGHANMGVLMGQEVARKLKEQSGDGTTTGIILLRAFVKEGVKHIAAGMSPILIKRGMEKGVKCLLEALDTLSTPAKEAAAIQHIATVSASGNAEIGKTIFEAIEKVGPSGVITIEEGKGRTTTIDLVEGMQFDRGYLSPYFCTDREKGEVVFENALILITDQKISSIQEILPLLKMVASSGKQLLIIAEDIEGDVLSTLVVNRLQGILKVAAVKAPSFGEQRSAILGDIAALTGGQVISADQGTSLKQIEIDLLGEAEKITLSKESTTLVGGKGRREEIQARLSQIKHAHHHSKSDYDKEKLEERRAKLEGGIAVIRVGAPTELEMKQKKQVFEDSLNSTRAAQESGFVPGGGCALLRAAQKLRELKVEGDEAMGIRVLLEGCSAPFKQIVENSGKDGALYIEEALQKEIPFGFNAHTDLIENLIVVGVIDPTKVVKNCLKYAASVAEVVLISEVLIGDLQEEEEPSA